MSFGSFFAVFHIYNNFYSITVHSVIYILCRYKYIRFSTFHSYKAETSLVCHKLTDQKIMFRLSVLTSFGYFKLPFKQKLLQDLVKLISFCFFNTEECRQLLCLHRYIHRTFHKVHDYFFSVLYNVIHIYPYKTYNKKHSCECFLLFNNI